MFFQQLYIILLKSFHNAEKYDKLSSQDSRNKKTNEEKEAMGKYVKYVNYWNSVDHPNCINLFVSATPWNLQTTKSRFNKAICIGYNKANKMFEFVTKENKRILTNQSSLHDIRWSNLEYNERKVRLMVSKLTMV